MIRKWCQLVDEKVGQASGDPKKVGEQKKEGI
jgi:hypothetical protein